MENKGNEMQDEEKKDSLKLTEEEINTVECFRDLPPVRKQELIELVYELSLAIYHLYAKGHE